MLWLTYDVIQNFYANEAYIIIMVIAVFIPLEMSPTSVNATEYESIVTFKKLYRNKINTLQRF